METHHDTGHIGQTYNQMTIPTPELESEWLTVHFGGIGVQNRSEINQNLHLNRDEWNWNWEHNLDSTHVELS